MPPVQIVNNQGAKRRLKFLRNTSYEGADYGPDQEAGDEADVDPRWAAVFLENGRAVALDSAAPPGPAPGEVQTRDPRPEHRDPQLPLDDPAEKKK